VFHGLVLAVARPGWRAARRALEAVEKVVTGLLEQVWSKCARLRLMCDPVASLDVLQGAVRQVHAQLLDLG
jgi:hypothetical protein